jgi:integrase
MVLRSAVRARLIPVDPSSGVDLPSTYRPRVAAMTVTREEFFGQLLPAVPGEHRALVCTAAGAGLRWGECAGLPWAAVDLDRHEVHVRQVAVEVRGAVVLKGYPKSRAAVRRVPLPEFLGEVLSAHRSRRRAGSDLVFATRTSSPLRRSNFRRQVWRPALVEAGLLGAIIEARAGGLEAVWHDAGGIRRSLLFADRAAAVEHLAQVVPGGLRFHDLRHSYTTWLVTDGVPINVVQRVMGHEQASTTLNRYTHPVGDYEDRVRSVFGGSADFPLTLGSTEPVAEDDE